VYIDKLNNLKQFGSNEASLIPVVNDKETVIKTLSLMKNTQMSFIVSRLGGVVDNFDSEDKTFKQMNDHFSQILAGVPTNGLLIAFSGPGQLNTPYNDETIQNSRFGFGLFKINTNSQ